MVLAGVAVAAAGIGAATLLRQDPAEGGAPAPPAASGRSEVAAAGAGAGGGQNGGDGDVEDDGGVDAGVEQGSPRSCPGGVSDSPSAMSPGAMSSPEGGAKRWRPRGGSEPIKYVLRLSGYETLEDAGFTVFYVRVAVESRDAGEAGARRLWYVRKRFRDFWRVRKGIVEVNGVAPALPSKRYFGNCEPHFLKKRAQGLSTFLWQLASQPALCAIRRVHDFLWSDVCVPPTRGLLPNTPLHRARRGVGAGAGDELEADDLHLDGMDSEATRRMGRRERMEAVVDQASSDIADLQGCMVLTSVEDLQRSFAREGVFLPEDDVVESDDQESDADDSSYLMNACTSFLPGLYKWYSGKPLPAAGSLAPSAHRGNAAAGAASSPRLAFDPARAHASDEAAFESAGVERDDEIRQALVPKLRFVIILVGSRGDVQPYVALGIALRLRGHYVRIAAHECFRDFVRGYGLGFAPLAGDPRELLRMVTENNMFSFSFVKEGLTTHRTWVSHVLDDAWDACTLPDERLRQGPEDPDTVRPEREDTTRNVGFGPGFAFAARKSSFRADAVIANPPAFCGWHIAEALGVPLYMSFPMPWSRTGAFPSPFTNSNGAHTSSQLNWMSYGAVDRLIWLGTGDIINRWRVKTLRIDPVWTMSARGHRMVHDNKIPFLYPWSPQVLPKPKDWGSHICIPGYWFLDDEEARLREESGQAAYEPPETLRAFLAAGEAPIFIGFGSIVVKNPNKLSKIIVDTLGAMAGVHRFVVQAGWSNLDVSALPVPLRSRVLALGSVPHRWLFPRCKLVVHHGGAGTTAEGLRAGKPTVVVPFFGDQFFWAEQIKSVRLGSRVPHSSLSVKRLMVCIERALSAGTRMRAQVLGKTLEREHGTEVAIAFIERQFIKQETLGGPERSPLRSAPQRARNQGAALGATCPSKEWSALNVLQADHWRHWPYVDLSDKAPSMLGRPIKAIGKRVKVVGSAIKGTVVSRGSSDAPSVELKELPVSLKEPIPAGGVPPRDFMPAVPPGHTRFSWATTPASARKMVGHTAFSATGRALSR